MTDNPILGRIVFAHRDEGACGGYRIPISAPTHHSRVVYRWSWTLNCWRLMRVEYRIG